MCRTSSAPFRVISLDLHGWKEVTTMRLVFVIEDLYQLYCETGAMGQAGKTAGS